MCQTPEMLKIGVNSHMNPAEKQHAGRGSVLLILAFISGFGYSLKGSSRLDMADIGLSMANRQKQVLFIS